VLRLPAFFAHLGHSNATLAVDGGAFGHQSAVSRAQRDESWKLGEADTYGDVSLADGMLEPRSHASSTPRHPHGHHDLGQMRTRATPA
jgi:hypothetical protein